MERAVLEFPRGITGVVGPNGCGKSNIVDALRWVLGEQSARHLRGQTMEDVIFAGNERYGALGGAEVSIVFDNEEGLPHLDASAPEDEPTIAAALRDTPEIEVTRRLFRSGESEYAINGRSCRLRDITELFLGTGVGTKAYSIVEQGRVGQIVGAKPEELRLYIEEAAGTTLYRSRKLAAERKIERTRNNLLRVSDILQELERQAASLRRQARGAERYAELRSEEEFLEKRLAAFRIRQLERLIAEIHEALQGLSVRDGNLTSESIALGEERDSLRARQAENERLREDARRTFYDARERVARVEQERGFLQRRADELRVSCDRIEREMGEIDLRASSLQGEESGIRASEEEAAAELDTVLASRATKEESVRESESLLFELGSRIEEVKTSLIEAFAREAALKNEHSTLTRQRESQHHREVRLKDEHDALHVMAEQLVRDISACQSRLDEILTSLTATEGGKENAAGRLSGLLSRKSDAEKRVEIARAELAALKSKYESLTDLTASFEGYADGVRTLMSNGGRERASALGVVAEILDIAPGYERAVAAVLEDRLQYVVVPDPDAGVRGAEYLRETGMGRASFIPRTPRVVPSGAANDPPPGHTSLSEHVSARAGYEAVVSTLLQGVVVADTLEAATAQWKLNGSYVTFVTREGEVLDRAGIITGGSGRPLEEGLLARKAELRELEETLARAARESRDAEQALETARMEADAAGDELMRLDRALHELTVGRVTAEGELELRRQNLTRTHDRERAVADELGGLRTEQSASRDRLQSTAAELATLSVMLARAQEERALLESERECSEVVRRERAAELHAQNVREAELRQKLEHAAARLQFVRNALQELAGRRASLLTRLEQERSESELARERLMSRELDPEHARGEEDLARDGLSKLEEQARSLAELEDGLRQRFDVLAAQREQLRDEKSRLDLHLKQCDLEREAVERNLRERVGVEASDALAAVEYREEDTVALEADLDRIRNSIRRLGVVNMGAVAELAELETRLGEMTSQRDDLERSIEDLRGTIARLNRLSKQKFKETFEAVNSIFQRTFPKLFLGGKAWLALSDENNLLETGVEIFVRPPGKKLGNLDLLSGGEKALTAVSLIFALFLVKPTPFCVLDEVDAPLDDANIGRFARMVSEMSEQSQFILITHNKRTMECCDMLYGVTMREPGVSKIVSVEMAR